MTTATEIDHDNDLDLMRRVTDALMTEGFHQEADQLVNLFADADLDSVITIGLNELDLGRTERAAVKTLVQGAVGDLRVAQALSRRMPRHQPVPVRARRAA